MKRQKFLEAASVRFQRQPVYPALTDKTKAFFQSVIPFFHHPLCLKYPGLLLAPNGSPFTVSDLAVIAKEKPETTTEMLNELERQGVLVKELSAGALYCAFVAAIFNRHILAVQAGKQGGNPVLTKPKPEKIEKRTTDQSQNATIVDADDEFLTFSLKLPAFLFQSGQPVILHFETLIDGQNAQFTSTLPSLNKQEGMQQNKVLPTQYHKQEGMQYLKLLGMQQVNVLGKESNGDDSRTNGDSFETKEDTGFCVSETKNGESSVNVGNRLSYLAGNPNRPVFAASRTRHARGSHGSLREPVLSTNNTLRVLKPYLIKYNCETNVSRSLCEPGGAGGIFEKTSNSPDEPGVARPTTLPIHETKTVANLDSLTANRPEQLFSPGSGFDGGTVPIANRTERTPATTEPVAAETRPTAFAPVPRFEHSLPADPALEGNDAGSKKPFVLKVLPIPNPFSSHPDVAKGDPELAASLLNGGFPPTKTPSLTTHDRKHEETTPPSCAPPPPPYPVFLDDEPVSEWHAPSPSDFVGCPDVEDFDPAELYDETTPIEDFDPSDPAEMSEPDDEDFAPMFDPPEISSLKTVSTAPEAISDAKTTPNESLPTLMLQDASTGFKRPANAILNSTSEKVCAEFEANSILDQNSGQKPDRPIEKKNPGVEVVPVAVVAAEKPSNPDLVQVSLLAVDEAGPAEVPSSSKKVEKAEKPKRAKKAKKAENPDDPAQAEYLANYRRLLTFYGDKIKAKIPNYAAQGAAVKWLLQQGGYTPDECEQCLVDQFENWTKGSPSWLTVKAHIAAWKLRKENPVQPKPAPRQSRPFYDNRDDRRRDRAPSPTQQIHNIVRVVDSAADQVDLSDPDSIVPAPPVVEEVVIPCSVPNIDACLNMLRRFHAMAIHVKKTGGIPVTTNMNHVGANWVYAQCKFPLDLETLSFEEIEKRYRHHHARLATALTKQAQIGNGTPAQNPQSAQSAQSAHPVQKPQNATPKGVVNG